MTLDAGNTVWQQPSLSDMAYVCSISEYNLAEFESCLKRKPKYLVLIVSRFHKAQAAADRFARVVSDAIPGVQVIRPDQTGRKFDGTDLADFQSWLGEVLLPQLEQLPASYRVCNITGGTKMMAMALLTASLGWSWLEYKAEGTNALQLIGFRSGNLEGINRTDLEVASPVDVARLYSEHVQQTNGNMIFMHPESVCQAQKLWDALQSHESTLLGLFGDKDQGLEKIWMYGPGQEEFNHKQLRISAPEFVGQEQFSTEQMQWLERWSELSPSSFKLSNKQLILPGNKDRRDPLRRWLSGDWLEQLAHAWLCTRIPAKHICMNVRVRPENETNSSLGERESDILVHFKDRTSIVEAKTDLPPGQKITESIRQLASITERFGRTTKVLFIGPQLKQKHEDKLEELKLRCRAEGIFLAFDKDSLLGAVLKGE